MLWFLSGIWVNFDVLLESGVVWCVEVGFVDRLEKWNVRDILCVIVRVKFMGYRSYKLLEC